jgi:tetratricopeptide (TPR) repeat protein
MKDLGIAAALVLLTVLVYSSVHTFQFVSYDDPLYVTENPEVQHGLTWHGIEWAFTTGHAGNWHPVTWISHMLDVEMFGVAPGPHHLVNLAFHIVNTLLLFVLFVRMTKEYFKSAFVAAMFAIHPLHVESVAWVSERKDVLSTLFLILTLWAYVSWVQHKGTARYTLICVLLASGLMCKPMLVTLPFLLLLLDIWPLGRATPDFGQPRVWIELVREKLPLFALAFLSGIVTMIVQSRGGNLGNMQAFPLTMRLANVPVSYAMYLVQTVWPVGLAPFYPHVPLSMTAVGGSLLLLIAISTIILKWGKHRPYLVFGWLMYLLMLLPVIGLIQLGDQSRADRYTYVPLIGIFIVLAWGLADLLARTPGRTIILAGIAIPAVATMAVVARIQVSRWSDSLSLWSHAAAVTTGNYIAETNLGFALASHGRSAEAIAHFSEAVRIMPAFAEGHNALGVALMEMNRLDEAKSQFDEALQLKPDFGLAHSNRGSVLAREGRIADAIGEFQEGLRSAPDDAQVRSNLGLAYAAQGRFAEAVEEFQRSKDIDPGISTNHVRLGDALMNLGKPAGAIAEYTEALRLDPGSVEAHTNLGVAFLNVQRFDDAIVHLREAVRLNPNFAQAHNNLGVALANKGRFSEAIASFTAALTVQPSYTEARNNLELARAKEREAGGTATSR